jgi:TolB-like protein
VKEQKTKIAVLPFREINGQPMVLGTYISEELVTDLFTIGGLDIVERAMLDRIIGELKLSQTGLIDPETAKKVGKIAGVDAVVTGSITDLQSYVALNCRLIDAQTGRIFAAAQTKIAKDDDVRKIMGTPLPGSATAASGQPQPVESATSEPKVSVKPVSLRQEAEGFSFELKRCTHMGGLVTCDLLVTNNGDDQTLSIIANTPRGGSYGPPDGNSRLISDDGGEYLATEVSFGKDEGERAESSLASGVPVKGKMIFTVSSEIQKAALLEIRARITGKTKDTGVPPASFAIKFRDVVLVRP